MNRRNSLKTAVAGALAFLWPGKTPPADKTPQTIRVKPGAKVYAIVLQCSCGQEIKLGPLNGWKVLSLGITQWECPCGNRFSLPGHNYEKPPISTSAHNRIAFGGVEEGVYVYIKATGKWCLLP